MKSLLLGNGINIQFGGKAYSNYFIMERIRCKAKLDKYLKLFDYTLTSEDIINILDNFVDIANDIRDGKYDAYAKNSDNDTLSALIDFQKRYSKKIQESYEIMLEDWFFLIHIFFIKNNDLIENKPAAVRGFEMLVLDAIYNDGKIQELFQKIPKKAKKFFSLYDNIFTLNYDNNIEKLTKKKVFHLHGDFSVLSDSENPSSAMGYIRSKENDLAIIKGMEHCFCNALLNYSGKLKYNIAKQYHNLIMTSKDFAQKYICDKDFVMELSNLKKENPFNYQIIMAKIYHPELDIATEYYFDYFESIAGELHIIGMSPNNDEHIFDLIINNHSINKVIFYYFSDAEKRYVKEHYPNDLFICKSVYDLWKSLDSVKPKYNFNYPISAKIDNFIECFNVMSGYSSTKTEILKEISQIPEFEMKRLNKLVEDDMLEYGIKHNPVSKEEFMKSAQRINYIALQEGILPPALYMIYVMNK